MNIFSTLGKGFSYFLMSMGVSTYAKKEPVPVKTPPPAVPPVKPE